jgi:hypothetical protein
MGVFRAVSFCLVLAVTALGGLLYAAGPQMSTTAQVTAVGSVVAVLGLPLLGVVVNWWVNESVYGATSRPQLDEH